MRIGISSEWIGQRVGGPERYARELIEGVVRADRHHEYRLLVTASARPTLERLGGPRVRLSASRWDSRWYFVPLAVPWDAFVRPLDLLHATFSVAPWCPVRRIVLTVHDVSTNAWPSLFHRRTARRVEWLLKRGLARASAVLVPTEATRRELLQHYEVDPQIVRVIPYGVDHVAAAASVAAAPPDTELPWPGARFVLYVGRFHARKNLERLLEAYAQTAARGRRRTRLVLVGRDFAHRERVLATIRDLRLEQDVWYPGHVSEGGLESLYRRASLFVYPSLHEGFGFPPLEAMARGVPVIASNVSAMPEVLGDGACLVDPFDAAAMAAAMDRLLEDEAARRSLAERGRRRAGLYRWDRTARMTLDVYDEVLRRAA